MIAAVLCLALLVRVLVMTPETTAPPDGFVEALGIQLAGVGTVEPGPPVPAGALADQALAAARAVDDRDAALAVWVVSKADSRYELNVVGRRNKRLFIERLPLTAPVGPDLARTLALKVGAVLDSLIKNPNRTAEGEVTWVVEPDKPDKAAATTTVTVPLVTPRPIVQAPPRRLRAFLELGARGDGGLDAPAGQVGGELGGGLRMRARSARLDAYVGVRYDAGLQIEATAGTVDTTELDAAAGVRATLPVQRLYLGAQMEAGVRRIRAEGETPDGARGSIAVVVPTISVAAVATLALTYRIEARVAAGLESAPVAQSFTINELPVVALGRNRAFAEAALVIFIH